MMFFKKNKSADDEKSFPVKQVVTGLGFAAVLGLFAFQQGYLDDLLPKEEIVQLNKSDKLAISGVAKEDLHFITHNEMPSKEKTITLYFSYTSAGAKLAYEKISDLMNKFPDYKLEMIHLNLSPEWEFAFKVKTTLDLIAKDKVTDDELFAHFTNSKKSKKNTVAELTYLLMEKEIDPRSFEDTLNSIQVSRTSASTFEQYISSEISFIPDVYINGNKQVVLGSLDRYSDIEYIIKTLNSPNNTPSQQLLAPKPEQ